MPPQMETPKIVVLDGHTLNPGDLSWDELGSLGELQIHDRTPPELVLERAADATIALTNKTVLNRDSIANLPAMKYIGVLATGFNVVDIAAARERKISVTNVPAYSTASVAQMTLALLLELTQSVGLHASAVRDGKWSACPDFCFWEKPMFELEGMTFGAVGYGQIGRAVTKLARAFGMRVLVHTRTPPETTDVNNDVQFVGLKELLRESDVVSLHCPLTDQNREFINAERLALMKSSAFLINTSRGPLIDESALASALESDTIAGAAVDVLSVEPPSSDNPLTAVKNCIVTPHIAWATRAARSRLMKTAAENIRAFLAGSPQNVVN